MFEQRKLAYKKRNISLTFYTQKKELPRVKKELPEFKQYTHKYCKMFASD
jgi:putative transposase